jgi:hypothetical protein
VPDYTAIKLLGIAGVLSYATARLATKAGIVGYSRYTLVAVPVAGCPKCRGDIVSNPYRARHFPGSPSMPIWKSRPAASIKACLSCRL